MHGPLMEFAAYTHLMKPMRLQNEVLRIICNFQGKHWLSTFRTQGYEVNKQTSYETTKLHMFPT